MAIAASTAGVLGARLTGGGFGSSVVVLAEPEHAAYERDTGRAPTVILNEEDKRS